MPGDGQEGNLQPGHWALLRLAGRETDVRAQVQTTEDEERVLTCGGADPLSTRTLAVSETIGRGLRNAMSLTVRVSENNKPRSSAREPNKPPSLHTTCATRMRHARHKKARGWGLARDSWMQD